RNESNTHSLGNGIYDSSQFHQLPNGHYVVEIPINIPLTRPSDHYTLSWISLRDTVENEVTYSSSEYETNKIEPLTIVIGKPSQPIETVTTPPSNATPNPDSTEEVDKPELPDAPVEVTSPELPDTSVDLIERDVVNLVVVVDEGTGRELFRFTINGEDYASQVTEKIAAYSLENQMSLTEGSHLLVSEQRSATTVGNYTKESIRREYKVSVKRDSELPLPEENTGFVPSGTLYDDVNSYRAAFDVGVYANGDQISSSDYIGTDTIDAVIRRALESVDSERYRYDRVEVNQGFTSRFGNGVNFSGQLFDIKVFLTEFQMKPIEPFISSETQPDLGKSPIVETGTSDVDVPKNESTTAPEISPETSDSLKTQPDLGKSPIVEIGTSDVDVPKNESTTAPEISPETSDSLKTQPDLGKSPIVEIGTPDVNIPQIGSETSSDKPIFSELPSESDDLTKISGLLKNGSDMAIASPPAKELTREMMHQSVKSPMSQIATEGKTADKSASLPRTNSTSSIIVAVVGLVSVSLGLLGLKKQER
ncbi:LPXTG cell wall anchor domain-containing protein, partial [Streptococcus entericus]